ncbi:MAG: alpha/beta fold hydrolase [Bdellovibrionales bacterium]
MIWLLGLAVLGWLIFLSLWLFTVLRPDDGVDLPPLQYFTIGEDKIAFYRTGQGRPLILLHGLGASAYSWRYIISELKQEYELIAIDLMGFGRSSKPLNADYSLETQSQWLHQTIQSFGLGPVTLVGSSMGGLLALWLAKEHPELYPKIIALSPATLGKRGRAASKVWLRGEKLVPIMVNRWTMPWIVLSVVGSLRPLNRRSLREYLGPNTLVPFLKCHQAICDERLPDALKGLQAATLVLRGKFDMQVSRLVMRDLLKVLPHAVWRDLPSAHHPQEHIPKRVSDEIRAWLNGQTDATAVLQS